MSGGVRLIRVELEGFIRTESEGGIYFDSEDTGTCAWLPRRAIDILTRDRKTGAATITLPEPMAVEKGLV